MKFDVETDSYDSIINVLNSSVDKSVETQINPYILGRK